jgi:hypothetical protein
MFIISYKPQRNAVQRNTLPSVVLLVYATRDSKYLRPVHVHQRVGCQLKMKIHKINKRNILAHAKLSSSAFDGHLNL